MAVCSDSGREENKQELPTEKESGESVLVMYRGLAVGVGRETVSLAVSLATRRARSEA